MENKPGIHGLCITVDSFDLRCESVTYVYHFVWRKILTVENFDESGLEKF